MEKYHYQKDMKEIIRELKQLLKGNNHGTSSDRALLLDYQATMETKPEKAIKLGKEALAQIKETTDGNAHLVSNLHANLGGLYRINGQTEFAKGHMERVSCYWNSISCFTPMTVSRRSTITPPDYSKYLTG